MAEIWWIVGALVLGVLIGAFVVWLINRNAAGPAHSVKALREENEKFRDAVNDHFVETAELINQLTDSYKKVFDHLSDGAERLVDDEVIRERMPKVSDQEIRLKRIGKTTAGAGDAGSETPATAAGKPAQAASERRKETPKAGEGTESEARASAAPKSAGDSPKAAPEGAEAKAAPTTGDSKSSANSAATSGDDDSAQDGGRPKRSGKG